MEDKLEGKKFTIEYVWERDPDYEEGDSNCTEFYRLTSGQELLPSIILRKFTENNGYSLGAYCNGEEVDIGYAQTEFETLEEAAKVAESLIKE